MPFIIWRNVVSTKSYLSYCNRVPSMGTVMSTSFLVFIVDQLHAAHLGCMGNRAIATPHIDALAAQGWMATECHVASPICMPNRASLMTGRMPSVHGVRHNGIPLSLSSRTFVDALGDAG